MTWFGREPWSSGYGRRLMFWWFRVQIAALYTGWTFFTLICCKNCNAVRLKKTKNKRKRGRDGPFLNVFGLFKEHRNVANKLKRGLPGPNVINNFLHSAATLFTSVDCTYHPEVPGSNPKHTIYALFKSIFVLQLSLYSEKNANKQKRPA